MIFDNLRLKVKQLVCKHHWGATLYDPICYGTPSCFSGQPHLDSFVQYCTICGLVQRWTSGSKDFEIVGHLSAKDLKDLNADRACAVIEGAIEVGPCQKTK